MFSKNVGVKNSNEAKVLAILEALRSYSGFILEEFVVESDSLSTFRGLIQWRQVCGNFSSTSMR